jgi:hypothetical protein
MEPVVVHAPVDGSYNSAMIEDAAELPMPPRTRAFPLGSRVVVFEFAAVFFALVAANVTEEGSYNSALEP